MRKTRPVLLLFLLALSPACGTAMTFTLSKSFVQKVKNRATLEVSLHIDEHLKKPHKIGRSGDDGDIHMAGRSDQVGLPLVAEIMNAGQDVQQQTLKILDQSSGKTPFKVDGIWRIWFEHPGKDDQVQGQTVPVPSNSNPDHVFELHPLVAFADQDLLISLIPIVDPKDPKNSYAAYDANTAFGAYEKLKAVIASTPTGITITSNKAGYNYVQFLLEPAGQDQKTDDDGFVVLANVYDESDEETPVTSSPRRMVFVKDSQPYKEHLKNPNGTLKVLGIPRIDLAQVAEVAAAQSGHGQDSVALPYEIVIVGVSP